MKLLAKLEKKTVVWSLIALCLAFTLLRLPSIIEPYWYGDEGIYEVIGQAMDQGHILYKDIWDNKPPLLYVMYAISSGDQPTVKSLSLIIGLLTVLAFYFLSLKLFQQQKISIIVTSLFIMLFATPILEANIANAEDFILLPIILAGLLIYVYATNKFSLIFNLKSSIFIAGLLFGVAFLFKIVAIFDLAAFLTFIIFLKLPENLKVSFGKRSHKNELGIMNYELWKKILIPDCLFIILGFLIPLLISIIYFASNHALHDFFQSAFSDNVGYVGWKNSFLGIPQGLLIIKLLLLIIGVFLIFKKRKYLRTPALFILIWTLFSLFNAFFSGRPYTHYAIVVLPSFCLFVGLLFFNVTIQTKIKIIAGILILVVCLTLQFNFNPTRSYAYYQNVLQFLSGQKSIENYQAFFDKHVPRDYALATFISSNTTKTDKIFIWGNNPQIYALAHKIPVGKYTVAYHISQNNAFEETQQVLNTSHPKYIIVLDENAPLPFVIPLYIMRYTAAGATIYERSL